MRRDLNMRKGKMIAQGAHASLGAVLLLQEDVNDVNWERKANPDYTCHDAFRQWIDGTFTKVCVYVTSEDELMRVYKDAMCAGLPVKLITDAGHTEFHGVPTRTCLAIGPCWSDAVDPITGGLPLL